MREAAAERRVLAGFIVTAAVAVVGVVASGIVVLSGAAREQFEQPSGSGLPPEVMDSITRATEIGLPVFSLLYPFVWWVLVAAVMQLVTRFFSGSGPFAAMLAAVGVAQLPLAISGLLQVLISGSQAALGVQSTAGAALGFAGTMIGLAFFIWHVALVVIGAAHARSIGYGESTGSCAISCVGILLLILLLAIIVGVGAAFVFGGA